MQAKFVMLMVLLSYRYQLAYFFFIYPIQGPRSTQGKGLLSDIIVGKEEGVHIMRLCRVDTG